MRRPALVVVIALILAVLVLHGIAAPAGVRLPPGSTTPLGALGGTGPGTPGALPPGPPPGTSIPFESVWSGDGPDFGYSGTTYLVIKTQEEWKGLWEGIPTDPPAVDFANRTVLVAIFGGAMNSGYSIEIQLVVVGSGGTLHTFVNVLSPGPTCLVLFVITYPVHIVSIPKTQAPVEFEERSSTNSCASHEPRAGCSNGAWGGDIKSGTVGALDDSSQRGGPEPA